MSESVEIELDGRRVRVPAGTSLAAALWNLGVAAFRSGTGGAPRGPLCGMGSCHECRVTVDGAPHQRACLRPVRQGMRVGTGG